ADVVADDDRGAAQFPGPHGGDPVVGVPTQRATPPPTVDGDHHGLLRVGVFGASLGSRPRAPAGSDPDIGLVVLARAQIPLFLLASGPPASMSAHIRGKSRSVFAVVPMSSTSTPGTRTP